MTSAAMTTALAPTLASGLACRAPAAPTAPALSPLALLAGDAAATAGFARAEAPRPFSFPLDLGPHPDFRSEWWYFTGVLRGAESGRPPARFGYQLTFFRQALAPASASPARASALGTREVYMAHLAVSPLDDQRAPFLAEERFARAGGGLAGATSSPFAVWTDAWRVGSEHDDDVHQAPPPSSFPWRLEAHGRDAALSLTLDAGRGPVLQGERGLSRKGPAPGEASYYLSWTRLPTRGRLSMGGEDREVVGDTWLDREWSTAPLPAAVKGWDWLGLRLSDGRDLMVFRLRGPDGSPTAQSVATVIAADGTTRSFGPDAFSLTPRGTWTSPQSHVSYPAGFTLTLAAEGLQLRIAPARPDQELGVSVRYWEGAVFVEGEGPAGAAVRGDGYLELTGYQPPAR